MDFVFDVFHGSTVVPHDVGAAAVIDGRKYYSWCHRKMLANLSKGY